MWEGFVIAIGDIGCLGTFPSQHASAHRYKEGRVFCGPCETKLRLSAACRLWGPRPYFNLL